MRLISVYLFLLYLLEYNKILAGVPFYNPYEQAKYKNAMESQGLYDLNDKVVLIDDKNFKNSIFNQSHAVVVEFYNSYCGFCRRFAPIWKKFAEEVYSWNHIVIISAIDCAKDENNGICRDFEIMAYPTIRYFSPNYVESKTNLGINFHGANVTELQSNLIQLLHNETNIMPNWPDLKIYDNIEAIPSKNNCKYIFVISEMSDKVTAANVILDLDSKLSYSKIFRIKSIDENASSVKVLNENKTPINELLIKSDDKTILIESIELFLKAHDLDTKLINIDENNDKLFINNNENSSENPKLQIFIENIKDLKKKDVIFQSDLETVLQYILFHEVPGYNKINGEKFTSLKNLLTVITRYYPAQLNSRSFLRELHNTLFLGNTSDEISGVEFLNTVNLLKEKWHPVFTTKEWIGCFSNVKGLRGYPCGLWTMFHYLTVQESFDNSNLDLEVLPAMHGYIKNFFGCTECSKHFLEMAERREINNISSKDDAVLWLWAAHNEVNKRLSGDLTEDPAFPKIQFPSLEGCPQCHIINPHHRPSENEEPIWNKNEVLTHLKRIYNHENLNTLNMNEEILSSSALSDINRNHSFGKVLTDLDMRMGILLYLFCLIMMIIAVKLFLRRGYRKKLYLHDLLGKV